jgi:hypothetical protein
LPFVGVMFICGAGVVCEIQIPSVVATNLHPSADEATQNQSRTGALLDTQVVPESVEE